MTARSEEMEQKKIGRPVRIVSISFDVKVKHLDEIAALVDREGAKGTDLIVLPETWQGTLASPEALDGQVTATMSALAKKHRAYIVSPIFRKGDDGKIYNSAVLLDREGEIGMIYDKVYPYWNEFGPDGPSCEPGVEAPVYEADFGKLGMTICFDANFPAVFKRLCDQGAELVTWSSAWGGARVMQSHAINFNYYIVTSTWLKNCTVFDINGDRLLYEESGDINISRITLDLDRRIYHENFNLEKRDKLLAEQRDVVQEVHMLPEQWFILKTLSPGISAEKQAKEYGLEELRDYRDRSRRDIDAMRGFKFAEKV
jgi:predicted amidohydrolase